MPTMRVKWHITSLNLKAKGEKYLYKVILLHFINTTKLAKIVFHFLTQKIFGWIILLEVRVWGGDLNL